MHPIRSIHYYKKEQNQLHYPIQSIGTYLTKKGVGNWNIVANKFLHF